MARKTRVGGLRSATSREIAEEQPTALPDRRQGRYIFRSRNASYLLSGRRRRITRGPDGEAIEEAPRSKMDNALDWVRFEDHSYETKDPEIAKHIKEAPGYGRPRQGARDGAPSAYRGAPRHRRACAEAFGRQRPRRPSAVVVRSIWLSVR